MLMAENRVIMIETINQINDYHRTLKKVQEKMPKSKKLVMILLDTPYESSCDNIKSLVQGFGLNLDLTEADSNDTLEMENDISKNGLTTEDTNNSNESKDSTSVVNTDLISNIKVESVETEFEESDIYNQQIDEESDLPFVQCDYEICGSEMDINKEYLLEMEMKLEAAINEKESIEKKYVNLKNNLRNLLDHDTMETSSNDLVINETNSSDIQINKTNSNNFDINETSTFDFDSSEPKKIVFENYEPKARINNKTKTRLNIARLNVKRKRNDAELNWTEVRRFLAIHYPTEYSTRRCPFTNCSYVGITPKSNSSNLICSHVAKNHQKEISFAIAGEDKNGMTIKEEL